MSNNTLNPSKLRTTQANIDHWLNAAQGSLHTLTSDKQYLELNRAILGDMLHLIDSRLIELKRAVKAQADLLGVNHV